MSNIEPAFDEALPESRLRSPLTAAVLVALLGFVYWSIIRPWYLRWGVPEDEITRKLPGHDLVPDPAVNSTQAVTIDATPDDIWPWIVQIGQGRGGFYSYDWVERLLGANIHNVDFIIPELQGLAEGDEILLAPKDYWLGSPDSWPIVAHLVKQRSLVLRSPDDPPTYVWTLQIEPVDSETSRLIARMRSPRRPSALGRILEAMTWEPAHFLMQRKMLLGIKERAEGMTNG